MMGGAEVYLCQGPLSVTCRSGLTGKPHHNSSHDIGLFAHGTTHNTRFSNIITIIDTQSLSNHIGADRIQAVSYLHVNVQDNTQLAFKAQISHIHPCISVRHDITFHTNKSC